MYSWHTEFGDVFSGQRVLVTGATGFIGWHLCEALMALNAEVHGLSRAASAENLVFGCKAWPVNLTDFETVRRTISKVQPKVIYHLASLVTARQDLNLVLPMLQNNLVGAVHLLLATVGAGCERIVIVGSSEEITAGSSGETPTSPYGVAKVAASMYARMFHRVYGLPVVVVRPFMAYGPRQEPTKLIPYTILSLLRDENPKLSSGKRVCDLVYILDVVRGLLTAGIQPDLEGKTVDLQTGGGTTVQEVAKLLVDLSGSTARPVFGAVPDRIGERPQTPDRDASRRLLEWEPVRSLRDGLMETMTWYRARMGG